MSLIKFENIVASLLFAAEVNDDMIVEELSLDKAHSVILVQGYEFAADGTKYHVDYSISIVDVDFDESEQVSMLPIVTKHSS
jgi:hypothetical protein